MLIIKRPLVLQTICAFGCYADILGEKIRAEYRLIGTDIAGEELLHMTLHPPEIYIDMQNNKIYNSAMTVWNKVCADNRLRLELINQLLNRIMLYLTPCFTYQDEVFVSSMLQKMGIMDVSRFMDQVKSHMERNRLLTELTEKYFTYGKDIADIVSYVVHGIDETNVETYEGDMENEPSQQTLVDRKVIKNRLQSDRYLHNDIFKRLMTAECDNILYCYGSRLQREYDRTSDIQRVSWIEQAEAIQLTQLRENMYYQENSVSWQKYFNYEVMPLAESELTKEKVMHRMAAAVLENIVQGIHYERQQYYSDNKAVWCNYTGMLYQSAADVIERFRYFQSEKLMDNYRVSTYEQSMRELIWDEIQLSDLLAFVDADKQFYYENNKQYADMITDIVLSLYDNQNIQKQMSEKMRIEDLKVYWKGYAKSDDGSIVINQELQEETGDSSIFINQMLQWENNDDGVFINEFIEESAESIKLMCGQECRQIHSLVHEKPENGIEACKECAVLIKSLVQKYGVKHKNAEESEAIEERDQIYGYWLGSNNSDGSDKAVESQAVDILYDQEDYLHEFISRYADILYHQETKVPEIMMQESMKPEPMVSKTLANGTSLMENAALLEQVNKHNIYMKQLLENSLTQNDNNVILEQKIDSEDYFDELHNTPKRVVVDLIQARRDALRMLEDPRNLLDEMDKNTFVIKKEVPEEIEKILRITDERTRRFYEELLGYDKSIQENAETAAAADIENISIRETADLQNIKREEVWNEHTKENIRGIKKEIRKEIKKEIKTELNHAISDNADNDINTSGPPDKIMTAEHIESGWLQKMIYLLIHRIAGKEAAISMENTAQLYHLAWMDEKTAEENRTENILEFHHLARTEEKTEEKAAVQRNTEDIMDFGNVNIQKDREITDTAVPDVSEIRRVNSIITDQMHDYYKSAFLIKEPDISRMDFTHKTDTYVYEESVKEAVKAGDSDMNVIKVRTNTVSDTKETQVWQKNLQDIKRELITQSEEHLIQLVERSLKAQVHTISDKVYLELERRLKNEQRRRGY